MTCWPALDWPDTAFATGVRGDWPPNTTTDIISPDTMRLAAPLLVTVLALAAAPPGAVRFPENPLITQRMSPTLGDDINGPSLIRVPAWIGHALGRYYLYFAHHKGRFIRMAYADDLAGPWKIYEPGVLDVKATAFYRPQPDPPGHPFYTHV